MEHEYKTPGSLDELFEMTTDYIPALEFASNTRFQHAGPLAGYFLDRDGQVEALEYVRQRFDYFKSLAQKAGIASA